jgi:hypothetical protein
MNNRLQFTGGEPDVRLDQILFGSESDNRDAMFAMFKSFAVGTNPNFIISGCVVTVGGAAPTNTWSMTAGYIYLNDEIVIVESDSGTFDSDTEFLAFDKTVTYRADGDKTFIDATPRQTLEQNRGTITVQGSVSVSELDALNGEHINDKIKRYVTGDVESSNSANITIGNNTKWVRFTANGAATWTITIPDPDNTTVYNEYIFIDVAWTQGSIVIAQADATVVLTGIDESALIILVNDGTATWSVLSDKRAAANSIALIGTDAITYMTPASAAARDGGVKHKFLLTGDWDMDATPSVSVAHGLTYTNIIGVECLIRNDLDTAKYDLNGGTTGTGNGGYITVLSANISLNRITSGDFDTATFDSTSYNRGWVIVKYI